MRPVKGAAAIAVMVALSGAAQVGQPPPGPSEAQLLERAAAEPERSGPQIALARFYYQARRQANAEQAITVAIERVRAELAKQTATRATAPALPRVGIDVPEPGKTRDAAPKYPEAALKAGVLGIVVVDAVIDKQGRVRNPKVVRSVPRLDKVAVDAVRQWQFVPTVRDGRVIDVSVLFSVNYTFRVDPQVSDDLDLAEFYCTQNQFAVVEQMLNRALGVVRQERVWFGPGPASGPPRAGELKKIKDVPPKYPSVAVSARLSGQVTLEVAIDLDGSVGYARVISPSSVFDQTALDAVRQWRFAPRLVNGVPSRAVVTTIVTFTLH